MATSGSVDFADSITRNTILQTALRRINVLATGEDMDAAMQSDGSFALNLMVKEWQAEGLNLWAVQRATLFLSKSTKSYSLGPSGAHCTLSVTETAVKVAGSTSDTSIDVDSTTGMTAADNIGIMLDAGTIHWDTIASVTDSDTVVITTGLASAAAVDNAVYFYTDKINRPLRVVSARRKISGVETVVDVISRQEYDDQPTKATTGTPTQVYYKPTLDTGTLFIWPTSDAEGTTMELSLQGPLEDFDAPTNNPYYPGEWGNALIWNLAAQLGVEYGIPKNTLGRVRDEAARSKQTVENFDRETAPIFFQPEFN